MKVALKLVVWKVMHVVDAKNAGHTWVVTAVAKSLVINSVLCVSLPLKIVQLPQFAKKLRCDFNLRVLIFQFYVI